MSRARESVAIVARPRDARPLFAWLLQLVDWPVKDSAGDAGVILRAKSRAGVGTVVLQVVDGKAEPLLLAKATLTADAKGPHERETVLLTRFGPAARAVGVTVPEARLVSVGGLSVTIEHAVPGAPAAILLNDQRLSVDAVLEKLTSWLETWNRRTAVRRPLALEYLERAVLGPARSLAPDLDNGGHYLTWLEAQCRAIVGDVAPLVVTHGDLTMSNVLVTGEGSLGIIDWEMAAPDGLPLSDFWYAAIDAVSAVDRYADRQAAFVRCMSGDSALASLFAADAARLAHAVGVNDAFATVCFHGCWLHHAVNERRKRSPGETRPFYDIVQWLAARPLPAGVPAGTVA